MIKNNMSLNWYLFNVTILFWHIPIPTILDFLIRRHNNIPIINFRRLIF